MKDRLGFLSATGAVLGAVAVVALIGWALVAGAGMFSPGSLNSASIGPALGGVTNHAQLRGCEACHTPFWSAATMADRCMACHTDVDRQIQTHGGLHGAVLGSLQTPTCGNCHSEHGGPNGPLDANFDHNALTFKLLGKHASVPCDKCHANVTSLQDFRDAPQDCYSCHAKDDRHAGKFGRQCDQCHTPSGWNGARFDHSVFPVDHGRREQVATCQTCHPTDVSTYTCFGCHRHTPANVQSEHEGRSLASLGDCIRCHRGGRGGDD